MYEMLLLSRRQLPVSTAETSGPALPTNKTPDVEKLSDVVVERLGNKSADNME